MKSLIIAVVLLLPAGALAESCRVETSAAGVEVKVFQEDRASGSNGRLLWEGGLSAGKAVTISTDAGVDRIRFEYRLDSREAWRNVGSYCWHGYVVRVP